MLELWSPSEVAFVAAYAAIMALLCVFGLHRLELVMRLRRAPPRPAPPPAGPGSLPFVTVQLPIRNERYVAERLLRAAAALEWPPERLEIQVLDDSSDDTSSLVARLCAELQRPCGPAVQHLRRALPEGFKAGALAAGLARAQGEFLLILDADFVAPPDILRRTMGHFADEGVGLVQARWGHLNAGESHLTAAQSLMLDGHFVVQHGGRAAAGRFFNFNGTAGVFRRTAVEAAGGWQHDTLTEDLDLSYRMQLAGYRAVYAGDVVVPGELPASMLALKSQQHRWAKGSLETCRKLLPSVWRSTLPLPVKLEATFHLTENAAYLLLLLLSVVTVPALAARESRGAGALALVDLVGMLMGMGTLFVFYGEASLRARGGWRLLDVPRLMALGAGLAANNSMAVVGGLIGVRSPFVRTPKTGGAAGRLYRAGASPLFLLELALAAWMTVGLALALDAGVYTSVPFLLLLAVGYAWVGLESLAELLPRIGSYGEREPAPTLVP